MDFFRITAKSPTSQRSRGFLTSSTDPKVPYLAVRSIAILNEKLNSLISYTSYLELLILQPLGTHKGHPRIYAFNSLDVLVQDVSN
jgi:hypothetical protein